MQNILIDVSDMRPLSKAFVAAHHERQHTLQPDSLQELSIGCTLLHPGRIRSKCKAVPGDPIVGCWRARISFIRPVLAEPKHHQSIFVCLACM